MRDAAASPGLEYEENSPLRVNGQLFLISLLILFLELACIRWFAAHVVFLTFFTNTVLLACFLGMSAGCLAAGRTRNWILWTPILLTAAFAAAHWVTRESNRDYLAIEVGSHASPQFVFFGTEYQNWDLARFVIPVEVVGGFFFLLVALAFLGPGQELGRALSRHANRVQAYTVNILGSTAGILLFAGCSWWELSPFWWFLIAAAGLAYFIVLRQTSDLVQPRRLFLVLQFGIACLGLLLASLPYAKQIQNGVVSEFLWSPYYRIDYQVPPRTITVNLIGHQEMDSHDERSGYAYALPHLLQRDSGGAPFGDVLVIGAGSGNDISRALQWNARHVDAVEIDPVIQRLGRRDHPDQPYADPRVTVHLNDGRNFLRATDGKYDLIVYALVDSLVLHSTYSNIRLESYLFTRQAFAEVRRHLKPGGLFVMYNFFRQGWIVARLQQALAETFGAEPLVFTLPYQETIQPEESLDGFTLFIAGDNERLRTAFHQQGTYWIDLQAAPGPASGNGFAEEGARAAPEKRQRLGLAQVIAPQEPLPPASDDWPFLYLRRAMIPGLSLRGMAIMGGLGLILLLLFFPRRQGLAREGPLTAQMFFLGAGFMLIETKAVVEMALLFGSTWMVNSIVFFAVLVMILAANLFVLSVRPGRSWPYYVGLVGSLVLTCVVSLDWFLGMPRGVQVAGSCLLVFAPVLFAAALFAMAFERTEEPERAFGANVAGALLGGLAEYSSMLVGFRYLVLVALAFYVFAASSDWVSRRAGMALDTNPKR